MGTKVERVEAYRTADGSVFESEQEALMYENRAKFKEQVSEALTGFYAEIAGTAFTPRQWAISEKVVEAFIMWQLMKKEEVEAEPAPSKSVVKRRAAQSRG